MKVGQVFVIHENLDWEGGSMKVVTPGLECPDDSKEFSVIDIIVLFCRREGLE